MKIAYVTQPFDGVLPPKQNSIGLIVFNTARLVAASEEVSVYLQQANAEAVDSYPFHIARVRSRRDEWLQSVSSRYPRWARKFGLPALADAHRGWASSIADSLSRKPVDVVHVMNYWGWSEQLRRSGHRLVLEMQSEWLSQMDPASVKKQLAYVDAVVPVSRHVERLFRDAFPGFSGVVATIHNGVDVDVFHPAGSGSDPDPSASARLLFVGRVSPEKGVHTLLDAFARVVGRFPSATLDIVGPRTELPSRLLVDLSTDTLVLDLRRFYHEGGSNYQEYLNDLVRKHRLAEQVRFHGSLGHHEIVKNYQAASIVVNPSLSETFGISMVEGMACGVPVVGTQVGGMLDTVTSEVGRLVPAEDPARLAEAICEILADRAAAKRMGVAGRARAIQDFTWNVRAQRLRRLYQSICAKPQASGT